MTLVFLVKRSSGGAITHICLAMKKRGFGVGKINGVGGKVEQGETIEEGARREANEETGVTLGKIDKYAVLEFYFSHNPSWNQLVHVYLCEKWENEPSESEEMRPQWYEVELIPYSSMWPDDKFWIPYVIDGKHVSASFTFGENDVITSQEIKVTKKL